MIESMQRRGLKDFFQINLSCFTTLISIHPEDVIYKNFDKHADVSSYERFNGIFTLLF